MLNIYAYDEYQRVIEILNKLGHKVDNMNSKLDIREYFFDNNSKVMLSFGLGVTKTISKFISFRLIDRTENIIIEDRYYSNHIVKIFNDKDILNIVNCNSALSDFIVNFEEEHHLDLSSFYVCCEAVE